MAEIVVLNRWREQQRRKPEIQIGRQPDTQGAQLLMFTGVRYERLDRPMQLAAPQTLLLEQN